jgi:hypothetical protein
MHLVVGDTIRDRLNAGGLLRKLVDEQQSPAQIIEQLFIRILSRRPKETELSEMLQWVNEPTNNIEVYEDLLWGMLNSTEFLFNH